MKPTELQLVSTEELIDELFSRNDAALYVGYMKTTTVDNRTAYNIKGNRFMMIGLLAYLENHVMDRAFGGTDA